MLKMWVFFLVVCFACVNKKTNFQKSTPSIVNNLHPDSLQKFSYFIFGIYPGYYNGVYWHVPRYFNGTGFFLRTGKRIFLVSAKHVLTPWNPVDSTMDDKYPDSIYIRVKSKATQSLALWPINTKYIKAAVKEDIYYKDPDVFVYEVDNKEAQEFEINSLETYMIPNLSDSDLLNHHGYGFGYPSIPYSYFQSFVSNPPHLFECEIENKILGDLDVGNGKYDSFDYQAYLYSGIILPGISGSPVFYRAREGDRWLLGGVLSSGQPKIRKIKFIHPNMIIQQLSNLLEK